VLDIGLLSLCRPVDVGVNLDPLGCCNSDYLKVPLSIDLPLLKAGANVLNTPFVGFPSKTANILQSNKVESQFTNEEY